LKPAIATHSNRDTRGLFETRLATHPSRLSTVLNITQHIDTYSFIFSNHVRMIKFKTICVSSMPSMPCKVRFFWQGIILRNVLHLLMQPALRDLNSIPVYSQAKGRLGQQDVHSSDRQAVSMGSNGSFNLQVTPVSNNPTNGM
jgi:hypothetical protein